MGPLIPNGIISEEWSPMIAIILGMFFGFFLEASGFSSSRKLMGVFYGYDFTVWRFFFTAVLTAITGLLFLDYFGYVDFAEFYIYPTYLKSILVGGVFMGLGFVIGGFCPGTTLCAVAIGKIDGIMFFLGSMFGIFLFSEFFPLYADFYESSNLGNITIMEKLNISPYWLLFFLMLIGVGSFYVTTLIRRRVKKVFY